MMFLCVCVTAIHLQLFDQYCLKTPRLCQYHDHSYYGWPSKAEDEDILRTVKRGKIFQKIQVYTTQKKIFYAMSNTRNISILYDRGQTMEGQTDTRYDWPSKSKYGMCNKISKNMIALWLIILQSSICFITSQMTFNLVSDYDVSL